MQTGHTRWIFGFAVVLSTTASAICQVPAATVDALPLARQIQALVSGPAVSRAHWGVMVTALDGTPIYSLNEAQLFQPASNAKLFTTAAALALLGPERKFRTRVQARGEIDAVGVLHGDLVLVGGGDANFGSQHIPYGSGMDKSERARATDLSIADIEELADKTAAKGIKAIDGDVAGDDTAFSWEPYPEDWAWDDLIWGYGAPVSALTVHDNAIVFSVSAKEELKDVIAMSPSIPYYETTAVALPVAGPRDCTRLTYSRPIGARTILIQGEVALGGAPCIERLAVHDPAEYAALALKLALERRGIRVSGRSSAIHATPDYEHTEPTWPIDATLAKFMNSLMTDGNKCTVITLDGPEPVEVAAHLSPTVREDVVFTNKVSQNLHAEVMLRNIGGEFYCTSSQTGSLHLVRQWILGMGVDANDFVFYDGSGLSGHDLVTPRAIATLLQFASKQPWFADYKASLPIGGVDGSLESRFTKAPLKGHVFAKTGTLGEARALGGYLECASGRTVVFSIMVGNHAPGNSADRDVMDRIVAAIAAAN